MREGCRRLIGISLGAGVGVAGFWAVDSYTSYRVVAAVGAGAALGSSVGAGQRSCGWALVTSVIAVVVTIAAGWWGFVGTLGEYGQYLADVSWQRHRSLTQCQEKLNR